MAPDTDFPEIKVIDIDTLFAPDLCAFDGLPGTAPELRVAKTDADRLDDAI